MDEKRETVVQAPLTKGVQKEQSIRKPPKNELDISYFQIFRYATALEKTATVVGVFLALISGIGVCYNLIQVGELTTSFVERTTYQSHVSSYLPLTSTFGGGRRLFNATREENLAALGEDSKALAVGSYVSITLSVLLCSLSVAMVGWSALRQINRIRTLFLRSVLRQDMSWFDTDSEFNLATKMTENLVKIKEGMGDKLCIVANMVGTSIICVCVSLPLGWELALACLSVMPFSVTASILMTNYQYKSSKREMESYSKAGKQAEEILKAVKTVIAFGGEKQEVQRYSSLLEPAERYSQKRGLYTGLGNSFNWALTYCLNAIGLMYGTRLILSDMDKSEDERRYVVGTMLSILMNTYMATQSITLCVPNMEVFASAKGAAASIFYLIERTPRIDSLSETGLKPRRVLGEIRLENVHFNYPSRPDIKILNGFSLHVKPGESVALVGSSGCGKSTIVQLLQRLYDPLSGSVKLDGKDLKNLNLGWLRSSLGVVGQEPVLFQGTIYDNITISCPEATMEEVQRVAEMAYAHEFITRLPNGYDTIIGERGASLSGGQKQRIAIARSLLREPAVLLLDEATSALDPHSERQVQAALDRASVGRTTISVSHRLSTIVNANRIICMDQGAIVEEGTHEELMKSKGFYYKLVTTNRDQKEPEGIEPLLEETENEEQNNSEIKTPIEIKKRDNSIKLQKQYSVKKDYEFMTSHRGSVVSTISIGCQSYTNNGEPQKEEVEETENISGWDLFKLNAPEWVYLLVGSIAAFVQGACFPAFALLFGYISGIFVLTEEADILFLVDLYSGLFILIAAIAGTSMCLQGHTFTTSGLKMTTRLRKLYFEALLRQDVGYYDRQSNAVGAICARLSGDTAEVQGSTGLRIGLILQGVSSLSIGLIMALAYNWKLTLVSSAFLPVMIGSIWFEGKMSRKSQMDERKAMESATSLATEAVISIKTVQSLGIENVFLEKFRDKLKEASSAVIKISRWRGLVFGLGIYVPFISFCSTCVYGGILVSRGEVDYKTVLLVTEAVMFGAFMLGQALVSVPSFNAAKACGARILGLINRIPAVKTEDGVVDKDNWTATGAFNVNEVEFSYPTRKHQKILKGVSLKVDAGKTVALVGSSGCGKSTILQLMQRFYDPSSGNIELNDIDIRAKLTLPLLRQQLGVVQQEPVLFDRTLAENIAYGDNSRKVTMDEIIEAAKSANIHSFIASLPKGYETNLGSGGAQLSGGQKQRVCIARALIRSPRLLLLDEATSALDANSERVVSEALDKAAQGRTCIMIAHRLSTIKDADLICVLEKGKIVEQGNHTELIRLKGRYWRMCTEQNMT